MEANKNATKDFESAANLVAETVFTQRSLMSISRYLPSETFLKEYFQGPKFSKADIEKKIEKRT